MSELVSLQVGVRFDGMENSFASLAQLLRVRFSKSTRRLPKFPVLVSSDMICTCTVEESLNDSSHSLKTKLLDWGLLVGYWAHRERVNQQQPWHSCQHLIGMNGSSMAAPSPFV